MYSKDKTWSLPSSASALSNNLSIFKENEQRTHLAIIHQTSVSLLSIEKNVIRYKEISSQLAGSLSVNNLIFQAKWVKVGKRVILAICSQRGVQIYEWDGSLFLHWHAFKNQNNEDTLEETFGMGVASCGEDLLCIGAYNGSILAFTIPPEGEDVAYVGRFKGGHNSAITAACDWEGIMATADNLGSICIWSGNTEPKIQTQIDSYGSPVTSLVLWQKLVVAAYGSGHIRVFDVDSGKIKSEVTAHKKWITAIDLAPKDGLLLSVSEDTFLRVWKLNSNDGPTITHKYSECIQDALLCGARFLDPSGNQLGLSSYDNSDVYTYRRTP